MSPRPSIEIRRAVAGFRAYEPSLSGFSPGIPLSLLGLLRMILQESLLGAWIRFECLRVGIRDFGFFDLV